MSGTQPAIPVSDILVPDEDLLLPWAADRSTVRGKVPPTMEPVPFVYLILISAAVSIITPILVLPAAVLLWLVLG